MPRAAVLVPLGGPMTEAQREQAARHQLGRLAASLPGALGTVTRTGTRDFDGVPCGLYEADVEPGGSPLDLTT